MLFAVPPLRVARLSVELRLGQRLHLPLEQRGNVLRGAFGGIFQRLVCDPSCPGAATCPRSQECAYAQLFEPRWPGDAIRAGEAPRGFLFRPPLTRDPEFGPHRPLRFELRLFGKAVASAELFLRTFQLFAQHGLADRAVRLESVQSVDWAGAPHATLVQEGHITQERPFVLGVEPFMDAGHASSIAAFEFLTPMWLRDGGRDLRVPTFAGLIQRVRDRISMLCRIYEGQEWLADFGAIGRSADRATTLDWDGNWVQPGRVSTRTGQTMPMGGFQGTITCDGIYPELWPLLLIGQEIHAGRHAVWGDGWYRVQPA
jgi:hypothetical protein